MKTKLILALASVGLLSACRVSDSKKEEPKKGETGSESNLTDPSANLLALELKTDQAEVYKNESITLSWSSKAGSRCSIMANNSEIGKDLDFQGSLQSAPEADTVYSLTCVNGDITETTTLDLKPLSDKLVNITATDKKLISSVLDFAKLSEDCKDGKICYFADLEKDLFQNTAKGWVETEAFTKVISSTQSAFPSPKILSLDSLAATFDVNSSVVYGYQGDLVQLKLDDVCKTNVPFAAGTSIPAELTLSQTLSNGFEEISNGLMNVSVFTDLKIQGNERRSVVMKGSTLTASFYNTEVRGKISGSYLDYGMANGTFIAKGKTQRSIAKPFSLESRSFSFDSLIPKAFAEPMDAELRSFYPPVPAGYVLPAKGYGGDENAFIPTDKYCSVSRQRVDSGAFHLTHTWYGPVSDYFPKVSSKRIVKGPATIQCDQLLAFDASRYKLGAEWKIQKDDTIWFVTDANWPSCKGYDCIGKEMIVNFEKTDPLDFQDVEPYYNFCIDRWMGIDLDMYMQTISKACMESDVYQAAIQQQQATENDIAFYRKCGEVPACDNWIADVGSLAVSYPPSKLRNLIKVVKAKMEAAKSAGESYLISDKMFSSGELNFALKRISRIRENFTTYENLRVSVSPTVNGFARWDFGQPLEAEFRTSDSIMKMMDEYDSLLKDAQAYGAPVADVVGCGFAANGKFRRYEGISVSDLKITPLSKVTKTAPALRDFKAE